MKGRTINYDYYENPSQDVTSNTSKFHLRINNKQVIDLEQIGERLQKISTASLPDIMAVVTGIRQIMIDELSQGNTISLDGICRVEPILGVAEGGCEGNERGNTVQLKTLRAHAVKSLINEVKDNLKPCSHQHGSHSPVLSTDDMCEWMTEHFKTNSFIKRRQLEEKFGLTRYMATKYLNQFVSEGKLYHPGMKNDSLYLPVAGYFGVSKENV